MKTYGLAVNRVVYKHDASALLILPTISGSRTELDRCDS